MSYYLNGTGGVIIKAYSDAARTTLVTSVTLPLCEIGGYTENWIPEKFSHYLQSLDITSPEVEEVQFTTGYWGEWELVYTNLRIPQETWTELASILNGLREGARAKYYLQIIPRSENDVVSRRFNVNYIGEGLQINRGTGYDKGLRLRFKTTTTQSISIIIPVEPSTIKTGTSFSTGALHGQLQT